MKLKKLRKISRRNALQLIATFTGTAMLPSMSFSQPNKALDRINEITKELGATESDHIKTVYILADGNPSPNVAKFYFTPEMGSCSATTRMRLSKTQNVYLLAENNNGQFLMTNAKVKVTIGGCGG